MNGTETIPTCYCRKIAELEDELKNKSEDLVHLERTRDKVLLCICYKVVTCLFPFRVQMLKTLLLRGCMILRKDTRRYVTVVRNLQIQISLEEINLIILPSHLVLLSQAEVRAEDAERKITQLNTTITTLESKC